MQPASRETESDHRLPDFGRKAARASRLSIRRHGTGARGALRAATDDIHTRLHGHPGFKQLAAGTISRGDYRLLLARSYGFYVAMPEISWADAAARRLEQDLKALGMTADAIADLPRCANVSVVSSPAEHTGVAYVLLGASLGGRVMARALAQRTGSAAPVAFLTGTGSDEWVSFSAGLDQALADEASLGAALISAVKTFEAFENWMNGWAQNND